MKSLCKLIFNPNAFRFRCIRTAHPAYTIEFPRTHVFQERLFHVGKYLYPVYKLKTMHKLPKF